jgi:flavin-dependent dehydrogenase
MENSAYDAIVVGARCAGSSVARLLARSGLRVLVVDRATFPSDTVSTHCITTGGCIQLQRWDLFDRVLATNVPHVKSFILTMNGMELRDPIPLADDLPGATSPRRTVLDKLLLDAAAEAGAEVREGVTLKELIRDDGAVAGIAGRDGAGDRVEARAAIVIGADGVNSSVARFVTAEEYDQRESQAAGFYAYFSGWPGESVELGIGPAGGFGVFPTNDEQVCVFAGLHVDGYLAYKKDVEATHRRILETENPRLGEWIGGCKRESRFHGWAAVPGFFRKPFGPGWALTGDAGYYKDPITGHGITDAFRDAELLADGIIAGLGGQEPMETALAGYQRRRDEMARDIYEATQDIAANFDNVDAAMEAFVRFGAATQKEVEEMVALG